MEFTIAAENGVHLIPFSSKAMNRALSIRYHTPATAGIIELKARPFGRTEFIQIEGADQISAEEEKTITIGYPLAEIQLTIAGIEGGSLIYVTIVDGE